MSHTFNYILILGYKDRQKAVRKTSYSNKYPTISEIDGLFLFLGINLIKQTTHSVVLNRMGGS